MSSDEVMCVLFAIACAIVGIVMLSTGGQGGIWFMAGAIWFHLASLETRQ